MENLSKQKENLKRIFGLYKKLDAVTRASASSPFNSTELQLLKELMLAKMANERLISTRIAKKLGVTRSSVSQMVSKLEKQGIIYREADEIDRKIAYIKMTPAAEELCEKELRKWTEGLCKIVENFGEDRLNQMLALFDEFVQEAEKIGGEEK